MGKQSWKPGNMLYPLPVVLVSAADEEGNTNVLTVAWAGTVCSDPPMVSVSIRPDRHSYRMIKETGEFVINLTTEELAYAADYCGVVSGRDAGLRSNNPNNVVAAAFQGLKSMRGPEEVARIRGKSVEDIVG